MPSFDFDEVDHLTFAAVGEPGSRVFLLQASNATLAMTLKLEKTQVRSLCSHVADLLEGLGRPGQLPEDHDLHEPYDVAWIAGPISVHFDELIERIIINIESFDAIDADVLETPETARIACTREQAADLIINGTSLVESGRPPCPLCGFPLDPSGHACPRTNGNRPPTL